MDEFILSGQLLERLRAKAEQANLPLTDFIESLLEQSELTAILQAAEFPQGTIFILDREKRFIYAGGQNPQQSNLRAEDWVGRNFDEIFPPAEVAQHDQRHIEAALKGESHSFEIEENNHFYQITTSPIYDKKGAVIAAMVVSLDITPLKLAQKTAQSNAEFAERLTDTVPDVIYIYDLQEETNIYSNRHISEILGFTPLQIQQMGMNVLPDLVHPDDLPLVKQSLREAANAPNGLIWESEYRMRTADGSWRWMLARSTVFQRSPDGQVQQILGVASDITERQTAEKQRLNLILQREKTRLIANFIQDAVHQFRTPLSIISTSLHLLESTTDAPQRQKRVERILEEIEQITHLVDNLATVSMLDSEPTTSYSQIRVNDALRHLKTDYQEICETHSITLELDLTPNLPSIIAQAVNFQLALQKIMENAVQYTEPGGKITLCSRLIGQEILVCIQDTGQGILPDEIPHIFERFYRGKSVQYKRGFGLGLAIAQKVIQLHSGRITVESEPQKGSTFHIWLPLDLFGE